MQELYRSSKKDSQQNKTVINIACVTLRKNNNAINRKLHIQSSKIFHFMKWNLIKQYDRKMTTKDYNTVKYLTKYILDLVIYWIYTFLSLPGEVDISTYVIHHTLTQTLLCACNYLMTRTYLARNFYLI